MSNIKDDAVKQKSRDAAQKAKQLPASTQYAIVQVLPNILNGCFWGFTDLNDIKKHYEALKQDRIFKLENLEMLAYLRLNLVIFLRQFR